MKKGRQTAVSANFQQVHVAKLQPLRQEHAAKQEMEKQAENAKRQLEMQDKIRQMTEGCSDYTFVPKKDGSYRGVEVAAAAEVVLSELSKKGYSAEQIIQNFRPAVEEQNQMAFDAALRMN